MTASEFTFFTYSIYFTLSRTLCNGYFFVISFMWFIVYYYLAVLCTKYLGVCTAVHIFKGITMFLRTFILFQNTIYIKILYNYIWLYIYLCIFVFIQNCTLPGKRSLIKLKQFTGGNTQNKIDWFNELLLEDAADELNGSAGLTVGLSLNQKNNKLIHLKIDIIVKLLNCQSKL